MAAAKRCTMSVGSSEIIGGDVDDRLSNLPEEISSHILSLMPTKCAGRTSILSRRWRYNWTFLTNLDVFIFRRSSLASLANALKLISTSSPMLETLSIEASQFRGPGEDYIFNIPSLKQLKLTWPIETSFNNIVLNVPNLEYLLVCGGVLLSFFVTEAMSFLVEASVELTYVLSVCHYNELLKGVSGVKSLSVTRTPRTSLLPIFLNLKHLELKGFWRPKSVLQFLERCPGLKHLHIEKPAISGWREMKLVPACMLPNLTTINFPRCDERDMHLVEFFLVNAEALKTVIIPWGDIRIEDKTRLAAQVLNFPRASACCEIHFL